VPALQSKTPKQSKSKETSKAVAVQPAAKSEINAIAMESRVAVEQSRVELVMAEDGSVAAVADPIAPIVTSVIEPQSTTSTESTAIEVDSSEPQSAVSEFFLSWHRYSQHPSFLASVAYALLYINVMNFGGIMSSFLKVRLHLTDATIATVRGVGAAVGIGSTLLVPGMISRLGLSRAAFVSIWAQCLCLVLVVLGFVLANSTTISSTSAPVILMLAGLCASRFGLWAFDITQSQIMQETVDSAEAGAINGTQESLVNVAYLGSFLLAVIWPDPHSFTWPTTISFAAVLAASFIYSLYFFRQPKSTWNLT
jgi:iron-regulated transporter 1